MERRRRWLDHLRRDQHLHRVDQSDHHLGCARSRQYSTGASVGALARHINLVQSRHGQSNRWWKLFVRRSHCFGLDTRIRRCGCPDSIVDRGGIIPLTTGELDRRREGFRECGLSVSQSPCFAGHGSAVTCIGPGSSLASGGRHHNAAPGQQTLGVFTSHSNLQSGNRCPVHLGCVFRCETSYPTGLRMVDLLWIFERCGTQLVGCHPQLTGRWGSHVLPVCINCCTLRSRVRPTADLLCTWSWIAASKTATFQTR